MAIQSSNMSRPYTDSQTEEDWLDVRRQGIGSSDVAQIMGVSPYGGLFDVWNAKHGLVDEARTSPQITAGNYLEPTIASWWYDTHFDGIEQLKMQRNGYRVHHHPDLPWAIATPDYLLDEGVVEIKNVGPYRGSEWGEAGDPDGVPDHVYLQVQWQLLVMQRTHAYVVALIGGWDLRSYPIEPDADTMERALEAAKSFRASLKASEPPLPDGGPASWRWLRHRTTPVAPEAPKTVLEAPPEMDMVGSTYVETRQEAKELDAAMEQHKQQIAAAIGDNDGMQGNGWHAWFREDKRGVRRFTVYEDKT